MKSSIRVKIVILFVLIAICLSIPLYAQTADDKKVLILNSYHRGYPWSDNIIEGIEQVIHNREVDVHLYIEYMDTRHIFSQSYLIQLYDIYKSKYSAVKFDVIISSDDNAFNFLLDFHDELFGNVPVVFCGVNDLKATYLTDKNWFTGVIEEIDIKSTLQIAHSLHPHATRVFVINDRSTTGIALHENLVKEVIPSFKDKLQFHFLYEWDKSKLLEAVKHSDDKSIILFLLFTQDDRGKFFSYDEYISFIASRCNAPIYSFTDMYLGKGIVGGLMVNGTQQGRAAAELADRILSGEDVGDMPILRVSPNRYMFDYKLMKRFDIRRSKLPKESIIINSPSSSYPVNKSIFFTILATLIFSYLFISILVMNVRKRKKAEKLLRDEQVKLTSALNIEKIMSQIARLLNAKGISESIFEEILKDFIATVHINGIIVSLFVPNSHSLSTIVAVTSDKRRKRNLKLVDFGNLSDFVNEIKEKKVFITSDLSSLKESDRTFFKDIKIESLVGFLLEVEEQVNGFIIFYKNYPHIWLQEEIGIFTVLANMIANTMARQYQFNERLEAERRNTNTVELLERSSRLASIGIMASGITHEINQPLNAIKVLADSMLYAHRRNQEALSKTHFDKISRITEGASRIDKIIKHMKSFWATPTKSIEEIVDLNEAVKSSLSLISRQLQAHGIEPDSKLSEVQLTLKGNYAQCEQIVINLVTNAIHALDDAGRENKEIIITTGIRDDTVYIEVSDNGIGLPKGVGERLFDPFYSTKKQGEGMGLGLAIVKTFVNKFNGTIKAYNNKNGGATFRVNFPLY